MTSAERQLDQSIIARNVGLKYEYRDRASLEANFREKFEALPPADGA